MTPLPNQPRGMYFEEFEAGQKIQTAGRTVTESDIVSFAGLSGDFNQIHVDHEFSKNSPFKQRVAHGLLGLSIISGLAVQTGVMEGTVIAFREINEWKFIAPVFIGDTLQAELTVLETRPLRRLGGGAITIDIEAKKQDGSTVMKGTWTVLIASRP